MTASESRSYRVAALVLFAVSLVRYGIEVRADRPAKLSADSANVLADLLTDSREEAGREALRATPLAPGEILDPNRADADQLDRLPGVGPSTARAIIEEREAGGVFLEPEDLLRVRGIGPATLEKLRPHVRVDGAAGRRRRPGSRRARTGVGDPSPAARTRAAASIRLNVNRADSTALLALPGIGPALAGRIVRSRRVEGGFAVAEDLARVPGIGPATVERLRPLVRF